MIVLMAGLPGTGKSTLARAFAARNGAQILDKDKIRAAAIPQTEIEYSTKQDDQVLQWMLDECESHLRAQPNQIFLLDGRPFSKTYQVDQVVNYAKSIDTPWRIIECVCPEILALQRIQADTNHLARNRDAQLYNKIKASFQPIHHRKLTLDTSNSLATNIQQMERYLAAAK